MTLASLQALTWGTVTGAVVSALLLASSEPGWPEMSRLRRGDAVRPPAAKATTPHKSSAGRVDSPRPASEQAPAR